MSNDNTVRVNQSDKVKGYAARIVSEGGTHGLTIAEILAAIAIATGGLMYHASKESSADLRRRLFEGHIDQIKLSIAAFSTQPAARSGLILPKGVRV